MRHLRWIWMSCLLQPSRGCISDHSWPWLRFFLWRPMQFMAAQTMCWSFKGSFCFCYWVVTFSMPSMLSCFPWSRTNLTVQTVACWDYFSEVNPWVIITKYSHPLRRCWGWKPSAHATVRVLNMPAFLLLQVLSLLIQRYSWVHS